jgi:hypothetical protein
LALLGRALGKPPQATAFCGRNAVRPSFKNAIPRRQVHGRRRG